MQNNPFRNLKQQVQKYEIPSQELRERFEAFVTNRKRVTRLAFTQAIYLYQFLKDADDIAGKTPQAIGRNLLATMVMMYKTIFYADRYGDTRKTQKLDEKFLHSVIQNTIQSLPSIDAKIQKFLKSPWKVDTLDAVVLAILRCATYELLLNTKVGKKIITSEYTNLAHAFFTGHEIGFVNAVLDSISNDI